MKDRKYKKTHVYTIYSFLSRYIWVQLIPILQSILINPKTIAGTVATYSFNILFLILLVCAAVINYNNIEYLEYEDSFYIRKGILIKRSAYIPYRTMHSVIIEKNFIPNLFKVQRLQILTPSTTKDNSRISLFLSSSRLIDTIQKIYGDTNKKVLYKGSNFKTLLMAATWSNSLTGLLLLAPFVKNIGDIFGEKYRQVLYENFDISSYIVVMGLPPLTAGIAGFFITGWAVAFFIQFLRYADFKTEITEDKIITMRGAINKVLFITQRDKINSITIKQSILMQALKLKTIYLHTIGTGFQKGDKSLLVPAEKEQVVSGAVAKFIDIEDDDKQQVKPDGKARFSYLFPPVMGMAALVCVFIILKWLGWFSDVFRLAYLFAVPVTVLWICFRINAHKKSAFLLGEKAAEVKFFSRLNLTHHIIPYQHLQSVKISQNYMQKKAGTCNVNVNIYSINKQKFIIKHLNYNKTSKIVEELCNYIN